MLSLILIRLRQSFGLAFWKTPKNQLGSRLEKFYYVNDKSFEQFWTYSTIPSKSIIQRWLKKYFYCYSSSLLSLVFFASTYFFLCRLTSTNGPMKKTSLMSSGTLLKTIQDCLRRCRRKNWVGLRRVSLFSYIFLHVVIFSVSFTLKPLLVTFF